MKISEYTPGAEKIVPKENIGISTLNKYEDFFMYVCSSIPIWGLFPKSLDISPPPSRNPGCAISHWHWSRNANGFVIEKYILLKDYFTVSFWSRLMQLQWQNRRCSSRKFFHGVRSRRRAVMEEVPSKHVFYCFICHPSLTNSWCIFVERTPFAWCLICCPI